jgi:hypothetical protein
VDAHILACLVAGGNDIVQLPTAKPFIDPDWNNDECVEFAEQCKAISMYRNVPVAAEPSDDE